MFPPGAVFLATRMFGEISAAFILFLCLVSSGNNTSQGTELFPLGSVLLLEQLVTSGLHFCSNKRTKSGGVLSLR